ncbi:hypothetical protein X736_33180 [Mesorhizobium sp. L2C089B000]|nr:hypothetical protein X736_33180 [Mesorhizobium sp. L2C089B000]
MLMTNVRTALDPVAISVHDLKTTHVVLRQDHQIAVIRVGTKADEAPAAPNARATAPPIPTSRP